MANNKKRWLTFEIYPDNPEQMSAFNWLKSANINSGMYIYHVGENGGKDHIHILVYEDNPINCKMQGEQLICPSYARRFGTFEGLNIDGNMFYKCRDELPEGKEWTTFPVISMVQGVSDPNSLAHYFLHERYCDIREGKRLYSFNDLKFWGNDRRFKDLYNTNDNNDINVYGRIISIASDCTSNKQLVEKIVNIGEWDLLDFIRKNPYFVTKFIIGDKPII